MSRNLFVGQCVDTLWWRNCITLVNKNGWTGITAISLHTMFPKDDIRKKRKMISSQIGQNLFSWQLMLKIFKINENRR